MSDFDIGRFADKIAADFPNIINFAADIITLDIIHGINTSKDISNKPFQPLKKATIKQKIRSGASHPNRPLELTGLMKNVYVKKRASRKSIKAIITMPKKIGDVGVYHNLGGTTIKGKPPLREWFGISSRADKKIDTMITERVKVL